MRGLRFNTSDRLGWRDLLLVAALCAAALRSLIPPGYMPAIENGRLAMVICTMDGARTDPQRPSDLGDALAAAQAPCVFAALAILGPPPSPVLVRSPAAIGEIALTPDASPTVFSAVRYLPHAARAPPLLSA